jgi:hypothetical protein
MNYGAETIVYIFQKWGSETEAAPSFLKQCNYIYSTCLLEEVWFFMYKINISWGCNSVFWRIFDKYEVIWAEFEVINDEKSNNFLVYFPDVSLSSNYW